MPINLRLASILLALSGLVPAWSRAETVTFNETKPGAAPAGWTGTKTGMGSPKWTVEKDASAPSGGQVLKQSGRGDYPLCLRAGAVLKDGFVEVKFKSIGGKESQVGAVIWRAQNPNNYFVARVDLLEGNVHLYRTNNGNPVQFDGVDLKIAAGGWHLLRVEFTGPKFVVFFDGEKVLTATDGTFSQAGQVGVGTKDDSVTLFDDFGYGGK